MFNLNSSDRDGFLYRNELYNTKIHVGLTGAYIWTFWKYRCEFRETGETIGCMVMGPRRWIEGMFDDKAIVRQRGKGLP